MSNGEQRWSCCDAGRFRTKDWGEDEAVIYDIASGDTHVMDPLAMEILDRLKCSPGLSAASLQAALGDVFEGLPDAEVALRIERCLAGLQQIGLVAGRLA